MNPIPFLVIILCTLTFEALLFGGEIAQSSFPTFREVDFGSCGGDPFEFIGCILANFAASTFNIFTAIFGGVAFFYNLITFNIPGAPWIVRLLAGTILGSGILWSVLGLIRGGK